MNLKHLEYFKILAETEHMTNAAKLLNTTQPNLSHAMSELENELHAPLFEKLGRNIHLTKYGRFFYRYVVTALDELAEGERALRELINPDTGSIDLGFTYTMGPVVVPSVIKAFQTETGNDKSQFKLSQSNTVELMGMLRSGEIDIALCSKLEGYADILFEPIIDQEIVLAVANTHPLALLEEVDLRETTDYPYIGFNKNSGFRPFIDELFNEIDINPDVVYEVEEDHTMAGFVSSDLGIAILPKFFGIEAFDLKLITITNFYQPRTIYMATVKERYLSPTVYRFKSILLDYVNQNNL